jgi:hypothetical protein
MSEEQAIEPRITVNGPRPAGPVQVGYPGTVDELRSWLSVLVPVPVKLWPEVEIRAKWLLELAVLCSGMHPELVLNYQPFLTKSMPARVAVVIQTYPPVVVCEMPFDAVAEAEPEQRRMILGPGGQRVN